MKKQKAKHEGVIKHIRYIFILGTDANIFYNQCREACSHGKYNHKKGIIVITGKEVTVPHWMPYAPIKHAIESRENINL